MMNEHQKDMLIGKIWGTLQEAQDRYLFYGMDEEVINSYIENGECKALCERIAHMQQAIDESLFIFNLICPSTEEVEKDESEDE